MKISKMQTGTASGQLTFKQLNVSKAEIAKNSILSEGLNLAMTAQDGNPSFINQVAQKLYVFITRSDENPNNLFGCVRDINWQNTKTFFVGGRTPAEVGESLNATIGKMANELDFQG